MAKLANGEHRDLVLEAGDTAIFSSRVIPGNEHSVGRLQNALMARGVEVITDREANIHVSGHPARDELVRVYQWIRPKIAAAGPWRGPPHDRARGPRADLPGAGDRSWRPTAPWSGWRPGRRRSSITFHAGRLARDGDGLVPLDGDSLRERRKFLWNGAAAATLVIDKRGRAMAAPQGLAAWDRRRRRHARATPSWRR